MNNSNEGGAFRALQKGECFREIRRIRAILSGVLAATDLLGCGESGSREALDDLYAQGLTRYVGAFDPIVSDPSPNATGVRQFAFGLPTDPAPKEAPGPLCLRGGQFKRDTRHSAECLRSAGA